MAKTILQFAQDTIGTRTSISILVLYSTASWVDILLKLIYSSVLISGIYVLAVYLYPSHSFYLLRLCVPKNIFFSNVLDLTFLFFITLKTDAR
jgi:hypothetical protein